MATKKKTTAAEPEQVPELKEDAVLPEVLEEEAPEVPVLPEEMGQEDDPLLEDGEELPKLAYYRVNWPGGVRLRVGPGLGYRLKTTLPCGTVVLGEDVADLLREDLKHDDSIWLHITCPADSGWVDGAYLERINVPTE